MYRKTVWVNNSSPDINAENLNHIEDGIYSAHEAIGSMQQSVTQNEKDIASAKTALDSVKKKADNNEAAIEDVSYGFDSFSEQASKTLYYDNTNLIGDDASLLYYVGIKAGESFVVNTSNGQPNYDRTVSLQFMDKDLIVLDAVDLIGRSNMLLNLDYDIPYMRFVGVPSVPWQVSKGIYVEPFEEYYIGLRKLKEQTDFIQSRFYDALDTIDMAYINSEYAAALAEMAI